MQKKSSILCIFVFLLQMFINVQMWIESFMDCFLIAAFSMSDEASLVFLTTLVCSFLCASVLGLMFLHGKERNSH